MFVTSEPLEHVGSSFEAQTVSGFNQTPQVFIQAERPFYVGCLENYNQLTVLMARERALQENILKSAEAPRLASLSYFSPANRDSGERTMHNIVNVWEWYSTEGKTMRLLFEDDKHSMLGVGAGTETYLGKTLIWSLTSHKALEYQPVDHE